MEEKQNTMDKIKNLVESELSTLVNVGIKEENINNLGKLVDIHKDIENECYWKKKEEVYDNGIR